MLWRNIQANSTMERHPADTGAAEQVCTHSFLQILCAHCGLMQRVPCRAQNHRLVGRPPSQAQHRAGSAWAQSLYQPSLLSPVT